MFFPRLAFASIFIVCCLTTFAFGATLPHDEVEALKSIAKTLGKTNWNFEVDPCSRDSSWVEVEDLIGYDNKVTCDCFFSNDTICHVVSIRLKAQNLSGTLPTELDRLPFLQEIDLSRNYLSGPIPPEWGSMQLINISLLGNRLTGVIPAAFSNISTLSTLVLEENQLSGALPSTLGNLPNIEKMQLGSNNFSGELPTTFARLTTLKDFRIADTSFTGKIPDFIFKNWTKLEKLFIQASGLSGPIPDIALQNLTDLRISDLNGGPANFPQLDLPKLKILILRSCNLTGLLPDSIGAMTKVKILDLSFNRLSGDIPPALSALTNLDNLNRGYGPSPAGVPPPKGCG